MHAVHTPANALPLLTDEDVETVGVDRQIWEDLASLLMQARRLGLCPPHWTTADLVRAALDDVLTRRGE